jgi:hypothetical protein
MFLLTQIFKQRVEGVKNPHRITPDYFFILWKIGFTSNDKFYNTCIKCILYDIKVRIHAHSKRERHKSLPQCNQH